MSKFKKTIPIITSPVDAFGFTPNLKIKPGIAQVKASKHSKIETIVTLLTRPKQKGKAALDTSVIQRPFAWLTGKSGTPKKDPASTSKFQP